MLMYLFVEEYSIPVPSDRKSTCSVFTCGHRLILWPPSPQEKHTVPTTNGRSLLRISPCVDCSNWLTSSPNTLGSSWFPTIGSCFFYLCHLWLYVHYQFPAFPSPRVTRLISDIGFTIYGEDPVRFRMALPYAATIHNLPNRSVLCKPIQLPTQCALSLTCDELVSYHRIPSLLFHILKSLDRKYS